jgi:hypothetical protein
VLKEERKDDHAGDDMDKDIQLPKIIQWKDPILKYPIHGSQGLGVVGFWRCKLVHTYIFQYIYLITLSVNYGSYSCWVVL